MRVTTQRHSREIEKMDTVHINHKPLLLNVAEKERLYTKQPQPFPHITPYMTRIAQLLFVILSIHASAQPMKPGDFGFRHIPFTFQGLHTDVLLLSKAGDESVAKPLFLFCQGSMPIPLLIHDGAVKYPTFPFDTRSLTEHYHLAIIGKPGIPLIADASELQENLAYLDTQSHLPPAQYSDNNYLDFYVVRNLAVLEHLSRERLADTSAVVVAGHSEGARVAFEMTLRSTLITHLIYASGNPCGQIMSRIAQARQRETPADSLRFAEHEFRYYEAVVQDSSNTQILNADSFRSVYSFSRSSLDEFPRLTIPVFICYGTVDPATPFNDLLRAELIRKEKSNFTFQSYVGLDHNYFGMKETGEVDYDQYNWDHVAADWLAWLKSGAK